MLHIKAITVLPTDFDHLVQQSESEGFVFVRRMENEWHDKKNRFDRTGEFVLTACNNSQTIGICGVNIDPYTSDTNVARLRHLYVLPACRSTGIGSRIVKQCLNSLHNKFKLVRLRVPNIETGAFYEKLGFSAVDDETATHIFET